MHYKRIEKDFQKDYKIINFFKKKTFICYNYMDNIKENLKNYKKYLNINIYLWLIKSINQLFSYLVIRFELENIKPFKKTLKFKQVDRRITEVR